MFANTTYDADTPLGENSFLQLYKFCDDLKCKGYVMKYGFMNGVNYHVQSVSRVSFVFANFMASLWILQNVV